MSPLGAALPSGLGLSTAPPPRPLAEAPGPAGKECGHAPCFLAGDVGAAVRRPWWQTASLGLKAHSKGCRLQGAPTMVHLSLVVCRAKGILSVCAHIHKHACICIYICIYADMCVLFEDIVIPCKYSYVWYMHKGIEHVSMIVSFCTYIRVSFTCMSEHLWTQNTHVLVCVRACLYTCGCGFVGMCMHIYIEYAPPHTHTRTHVYMHAIKEKHIFVSVLAHLPYGCPSPHPVNSNVSTSSHIKFGVINKNTEWSGLVTSREKSPKLPLENLRAPLRFY